MIHEIKEGEARILDGLRAPGPGIDAIPEGIEPEPDVPWEGQNERVQEV